MKYKIIDFDHGVGGLTTGMEQYKDKFEVIAAPWINSDNSLCYNVNHKNFFESGEEFPEDFDVAIFYPNLGTAFARSGHSNFDLSEIKNVFNFLDNFEPNYAIIYMRPEATVFMGDSADLRYTADGWPVYDIVVDALDEKYNVFQFVIDGANYGVPQHKIVSFYLCVKKGIDFQVKKPKPKFNIQTGFITIQDAIGDIEGKDYSDFSNTFIQYCTNFDNLRLTWHDFNLKSSENCSHVKQGSNARRTKELTQVSGYIRPKYNKICPTLYFDYYLTSSSKASIHPVQHRPFTIREGARLFGLPDTFVWNTSLSKKKVAGMIYNSVSPIYGRVVAEILLNGMG